MAAATNIRLSPSAWASCEPSNLSLLDGVPSPPGDLDLSLLPGELPLEFVDAGVDCGHVDSIGDLTSLG